MERGLAMQKPICHLCGGVIDFDDLTVREVAKKTRHLAKEPGEASGCGCLGCLPGMFLGGGSLSAGETEEERQKQPFHKRCWRKYEGKPGFLVRCLIAIGQIVLLLVLIYLLFLLGTIAFSIS
jgi:hypothetical protein